MPLCTVAARCTGLQKRFYKNVKHSLSSRVINMYVGEQGSYFEKIILPVLTFQSVLLNKMKLSCKSQWALCTFKSYLRLK